MKRLFLPVTLLLCLSALLSSNWLATQFVAWQIEKQVECESVTVENGAIVIEAPHWKEKYSAERVCLMVGFDLFRWTLSIRGTAIHPNMQLERAGGKKGWIKTEWELQLVDGTVSLPDGTQLAVQGKVGNHSTDLQLSTGLSEVKLQFSKAGRGRELTLDLRHSPFSILDQLMQFAGASVERRWSLTGGTVNGLATFRWEAGMPPTVEGRLAVHNASAHFLPWSIGNISGELSFVDEAVAVDVVGTFGQGENSCIFFAKEAAGGDISITIKGPMHAIAPLLPRVYRDLFEQETFVLRARVGSQASDLTVGGELTIDDGTTIPFDFTYSDDEARGHLRATNVDASKYIRPLLKGTPHFAGLLDLEATVEPGQVWVRYSGENCELESPLFRVTAERIVSATHHFDLQSGSQSGSIPLVGATYFEKKTGLLFEEIATTVELQGSDLHVEEITAICHGVAFQGSVGLQEKHLSVTAPLIEGDVAGTQKILSHICPTKVWEIPAGGEVAGKLDLDIFFSESVSAEVSATVSNGECGPLNQLKTALTYNHLDRTLTLSNLSGAIGETPFSSDLLTCRDFPRGELDFDVDVASDGRVVGTFSREGIELNSELSHFGEKPLILSGTFAEEGLKIPHFQFGEWQGSAEYGESLSLTLQLGDSFSLDLANVTLVGDLFQAQTLFEGRPYWLSFNRDGEVTIANGKEGPSLSLFWDLEGKPFLTRIKGCIDGLDAHLVRDHRNSNDETLFFYGSLAVQSLSPHVPEGLTKFLQGAKLAGNFRLSGTFSIPTASLKEISFNGDLKAEDYSLMNIPIDYLAADLAFDPNSFALTQLFSVDAAGSLTIKEITGQKESDTWRFSIPLVEASDIRPWLARGGHHRRNLLIPKVEMQNIKGTSHGMHTFTGSGHLTFANPPKRDLRNTVFAIPDDILGRIGLDFGSLIPASGRINYTLSNGKVHFNKFDHVYSHAERSQFFLAKGHDSSMSLDGTLDVKVRMRHYNLILKLTELFVVGVEGKLQDPQIRLQ